MTNFAQARKNMIDSQIATMGVVNPAVLDAMGEIPRERFVPAGKEAMAYVDEDVKLGQSGERGGSFLMEPLIFARLVQAAAPVATDTALIVGDMTGYAAAVMARLVGKVVVAESVPGQSHAATAVWSELGFGNIIALPGNAVEGCPDGAPFSIILVNGSVAGIPAALMEQLAESGRLVTVLRKSKQQEGRAILVTKLPNGTHSSTVLFDAATPFVADLAPKKSFVF
jgi:protein-L-isoaspartate(D-aspartate) O-methyltransferase